MKSSPPDFAKELFEFRALNISGPSSLLGENILSGWFLIHILFSIHNLTNFDILRRKGIKFETQNMIRAGWYRMYLTTSQAIFLESHNYAELYPILREKSILSKFDYYLLYAHSGYVPPTNYSQIDENLFVVSDISHVQNDPMVLKITPHSLPQLENRYAGGFSQTGNEFPEFVDDKFLIPRPLHYLNISGTGQVVSVADSGLDSFHCSFYDPNVTTPFRVKNSNHRKIILYDPVADDKDPERGHGTHVCGIIAGKSYCRNCGLSMYDGMAPDAKIYMHDLGSLSKGPGDIQDINLPYFIERARYVGSHISSNSWGYPTGEDELRASYSRAAYYNSDILFIFAAGNSHSSYTIHTPGSSKNVLTVGAITAPFGANYDSTNDAIMKTSESMKYSLGHLIGPTVTNAMKNNPSMTYINKTILYFDNSNSKNNDDVTNKIIVLDPDLLKSNKLISNYKTNILNRNFCEHVQNNFKNADFVVLTHKYTFPFNVSCNPTIPVYYFTNKTDSRIPKIATIYPYYPGKPNRVSKLGLSSQGPSNLGYIKPEIVAPGQYMISSCAGSPKSQTPRDCSTETLVKKSGTSMSAPVVSGLMALIRQYFVDGWYPTLTPSLNDSLIPSSTLMRAFAINSAETVDSLIATGFGVMRPYEGLGFVNLGFRIAHNHSIPSESHNIYKIYVKDSGYPLSVTMSYLDPPLPAASFMPLFGDLDLIVTTPNGNHYQGNEIEDQFATTEKVRINSASKGTYTIHVISSSYGMPTNITYSIAVNGRFNQYDFKANPAHIPKETTTKCLIGCKHGKCINGVCICSKGYKGNSCNTATQLADLTCVDIDLKNRIVYDYRFKLIEDSFTINFEKTARQSIIYCFNFEGKTQRIVHPDQVCYCQIKNSDSVTFNKTQYPTIGRGNFIALSIYSVTATSTRVKIFLHGAETHFSLIDWFVHLPIWVLIIVGTLIGVGIIIFGLVFMLTLCNPLKISKSKKKRRRHLIKKIEEPHPIVPEQDPNEKLTIEENLL